MATIDINDTSIHYECSGDGPAILFVHGAFGHADVWADQAERFADRYTCVRYDRRGYSRSPRGDAQVTIAQHVEDAAALIEALDLAPCLVVGSSSGAATAVGVALRHGRLLRGAVYCEPPMFSLDPDAGQAAMGKVQPLVEEALTRGGPRAVVEAFASVAFPEGWALMDETRRNSLRDNAQTGLEEIGAPALEVGAVDLSPMTVPALVIAGTTSVAEMRSITRRLAAVLADARFVEIDGGHLPHIEHPEAFAQAVSTFAAELESRPAVSR